MEVLLCFLVSLVTVRDAWDSVSKEKERRAGLACGPCTVGLAPFYHFCRHIALIGFNCQLDTA